MIRDEYGAARTAFQTTSIHTGISDKPAPEGYSCRVCGGAIKAGEPYRRRQWFLEYAHEGCGWLRADEHDVREVRRPGTTFAFYQWRCPSCGLDACEMQRPDDESEMRCVRCAPDKHKPVVGARVELVVGVWYDSASRHGGGHRRYRVPRGTRARVLEEHGELVTVGWIASRAPKVKLPRANFIRV